MTVIERRERRDEFPVGMRVLAVDDDPTCLKVLESLLLRCQYHVTTTNQAIKALKMLRENKDQFDLVISDVHMPDMDGFKLLELMGLEMDLPVIMLSANGETQAVMKGITHGACDYLIKPVRIEELRNIWQHVIRRKKFDPRDKNNSDSGEDCDKTQFANSEGAQGSFVNGSSDSKLSRKRKDQNDEDEEDDDNLIENDDPSTQKKPRVVWTIELHRKFVSAVNQLGLDKAVPKRILDLMNVESLTRENVASHLQKYRLYLKRLSAVTNQQVNMAAILRSGDPSYLSIESMDGYSNFNSLVGSRPLPGRSSSTTTFQSNESIPRMNSFNGFGLHGFVPPRSLNNTSNPINGIAKLPSLQNHRQGTLIQGMPTSLELDRLQQPKAIQETNNYSFNNFSGSGIVGISHSSNSFTNATKNSHILQPSHQRTQPTGLSNQSSVRIPSLSSDPFEGGIGTMSLPYSHNDLSSSPIDSLLGSNARDVSCSNVVANAQNQVSSLITTTSVNGDANSSSFESLENSNFKWEALKQGQLQNPCLMFTSLSNFSVPNIHINDQNSRDQRLGTRFSNKKMDGSSLQGGFGSGGSGLADIVGNALIKPECDDIDFMDGDMGCSDLYDISLGACI